MAVILDEEEEQRLREEEARLLAEQEAASRLPKTAIPADNVAFTNGLDGQIQVGLPEGFAPAFNRQMIGDEQYMQEVARARAGSGFIAGYGDTQTYDPAIAEAAQRREQDKLAAQAERFMGVQGYQACIKAGGKPEECIALHGPKMYGGDAKGLVDVVTRREPVARVGRPAPVEKARFGSIPPDVIHERGLLEKEAAELRADLRKGTRRMWSEAEGKTVEVELNPSEKVVLQEKIDAFKRNARELTHPGGRLREEYNTRIDQNGFNRERWDAAVPRPTVQEAPAAAPVSTATPTATKAVNELRRATKNGRVAVYDDETKRFIRWE